MEWLNYHHLYYFWVVAREGSIARATTKLRLTQPTISAQIKALEEQLGTQLFEREGRGLTLSEVGQVAFRYADEIFALGRDLQTKVKGRGAGGPRLQVGVVDALPKLIAYQLLLPAFQSKSPVRAVLREDNQERLLSALALHELDVVLSDAPVSPALRMAAFSHLLGESAVALFGAPALALRYRAGFPGSLQDAPLLLPLSHAALRRSLDRYLQERGVQPRVVGEFEDSALLKVFGRAAVGVFAAPVVLTEEIGAMYGCEAIGVLEGVEERFYAISTERKIRNPAVAAICRAARERQWVP